MEVIGMVRPTNLLDLKSARAVGFKKVEAKIFTVKDIQALNSLEKTGLEIVEMEIIGEDPAIWKMLRKEKRPRPLLIDGTEDFLRRALGLKKAIPDLEILVEFLPRTNPWRRGEKCEGKYKSPTTAEEMLDLIKQWPTIKVLIDFAHIFKTAVHFYPPLILEINKEPRVVLSQEAIDYIFQTLDVLKGHCWQYAHFNDFQVTTRLGMKPLDDGGDLKRGFDAKVVTSLEGREMYAQVPKGHLHLLEGDIFWNISLRQVLKKLNEIGIKGVILETTDKDPQKLRRDIEIIQYLSKF